MPRRVTTESNVGSGTPEPAKPDGVAAGEVSDAVNGYPLGRMSIVIVHPSRVGRELLTAQLTSTDTENPIELQDRVPRVLLAATIDEAEAALRTGESGGGPDAVIVHAEMNGGLELVRRASRQRSGTAWVVCGEVDLAEAMACGATDVLGSRPSKSELEIALVKGIYRARATAARDDRKAQARRRRERRLQRLCDRLSESRGELVRQIRSLCETFTSACDSMASQIEHGSMAAEFNTLLRQELDVESLLRTVLEYVLPRLGPTNAAIFLPSTTGDFTVGAYVNLDGPKDGPEVLMDHLAAVIAPAMEHGQQIVLSRSTSTLEERLNLESDALGAWVGPAAFTTFACIEDGECLAVVALWRSDDRPYDVELMPTLEVVRDLFSKQLARIVKVHHRHTPDSAAKDRNDEFDLGDDLDLAA